MATKVKIPQELINKLTQLPEQGMGYQIISVYLKDGTILKDRRVLNSTYLLLNPNEEINTEEIIDVNIERKTE